MCETQPLLPAGPVVEAKEDTTRTTLALKGATLAYEVMTSLVQEKLNICPGQVILST